MRTTCGIHADKRHKKHKTTFNSGGRKCSAPNLIILHTTLGTEHSNFKKHSIMSVYSGFYPIPGFDIACAVQYWLESHLVVTCHAKQTLLQVWYQPQVYSM